MTVSTLPLPPGKRCNPPSPPPPLRAEKPEGAEWRKAGEEGLVANSRATLSRASRTTRSFRINSTPPPPTWENDLSAVSST